MKIILRRLLSERARAELARLKTAMNAGYVRLAARAVALSYPWYLASSHFRADFASFVAGSAAFYREDGLGRPNLSQLRRDIHRIEKGLSFPERRRVFALRFILDAVNQFCYLASDVALRERSEYTWARDVLKEYFSATESDESVYTTAKKLFYQTLLRIETVQPKVGNSIGGQKVVECHAAEVPSPYINKSHPEILEALESLLRQRKSVRRYLPDPIAPNIIEAALNSASRAPSSCNRQPYIYYVVTDPKKARAIGAVSAGTEGWLNEIYNIAVLVGDRSYFANAVNRHSIYIDATLSVMPFVLSLEAQGVSTCLINWADDNGRRSKIDRLLELKPYQRVIISIAFGFAHPESIAPNSKRKFYSEISHDDQ